MRCSARSVVYRARGKQVSQSAEFGAVTCAMATRSMPDIDFGHPRPHIANAALRARGDCTGCVTLTEYLIKGLIHTIIPPGNVDFRRIKVHWKTIGVQTSASGIDPVESTTLFFSGSKCTTFMMLCMTKKPHVTGWHDFSISITQVGKVDYQTGERDMHVMCRVSSSAVQTTNFWLVSGTQSHL